MEKEKKAIAELILKQLHTIYDNPKTELKNWENPFQFAVCVILSAQATDVGVNKITKALFEKYKTVADFAQAKSVDLQQYVKTINYYKTKADRIINAAQFVVSEFKGELPHDINELIKIPGIGRKSANVIIHEALDGAPTQGVVVDTHVTPVSFRLGLTSPKNAVKIEDELKNILPKSDWQFYSNAAVLHGRYTCKARKPQCSECVLSKLCPSAFKV